MDHACKSRTPGVLLVAGILVLTAAVFRTQLIAAFRLSLKDDRYLQIALAPLLCLFLLYWERTAIFPQARFSPRAGSVLISIAMLFGLTAMYSRWPGDDSLRQAVVLFAVVLTWISAFILCYGRQSFRKASFALCCLFLIIPVSPAAMDWATFQLQHGSAATSFELLRVLGIPVFREGMTFMLPGLVFKVAPECSGIHSWLAFVIVAMLSTRVFLRSRWAMVALVALTIPIAIFKNAVRIVVISSLTAYVDQSIISSPLHHNGGPLFALVDLAIFVPLLVAAHRIEARRRRSAASRSDMASGSDFVANAAG